MSGQLYPNLLLVEGPNDQNVIRNLWAVRFPIQDLPVDRGRFWAYDPDTYDPQIKTALFEIKSEGKSGGINVLLQSFPEYLKNRPPVLTRLGIVVDADEHLDRRWDEVKVILQRAGYVPPPVLPPEGLVVEHPEGERPRIGVWVMPDNQLPGRLEDFVRQLIPADDLLHPKAEQTLAEINESGLQRFTDSAYCKALIHTWLAWQDEPGRPMGQAITARSLTPTSPLADRFIFWLRRLFVE